MHTRLRELSHVCEHDSKIVFRQRVFRVEGNGSFKFGFCASQIALLVENDAEIVADLCIFRVHLQRRLEMHACIYDIMLISEEDSEKHMCWQHAGCPFERAFVMDLGFAKASFFLELTRNLI